MLDAMIAGCTTRGSTPPAQVAAERGYLDGVEGRQIRERDRACVAYRRGHEIGSAVRACTLTPARALALVSSEAPTISLD